MCKHSQMQPFVALLTVLPGKPGGKGPDEADLRIA